MLSEFYIDVNLCGRIMCVTCGASRNAQRSPVSPRRIILELGYAHFSLLSRTYRQIIHFLRLFRSVGRTRTSLRHLRPLPCERRLKSLNAVRGGSEGGGEESHERSTDERRAADADDSPSASVSKSRHGAHRKDDFALIPPILLLSE